MKHLYQQRVARVIALAYGVYLAYYLGWRAAATLNPDALGFSLLLLSIEGTSLASFALFALMTWDVQRRKPFRFRPDYRVDVFVPTYNEDVAILEATLVGCNAITYPHTTYVLDDGRRPEVEQLARRLRCHYLTRADNAHAKAGNLNAALARTSGELIVVLDADTVPQPDFLHKTVGYFTDQRVALVQLPQEFYNFDSVQHVGRGDLGVPWHEQELFYRVIQPGKDRWNASFWCGSPSVIRRAALESVGGVATESITEDLHTTLRLHARGWKTAYHHEALAFGIAAQTLEAFTVQRLRWAQGTMQILRSRDNPLLLPGLSLAQRLSHLASMVTYLEAYQKLAYLLAPPVTLVTGVLAVDVDALEFAVHWLPYFVLGVLANVALGRGSFRYLETEQYNLLKMFTFIWASMVLLWRRPLRFRVTPKQVNASARALERRQLTPHLILLGVIGLTIVLGALNLAWGVTTRYADPTVVTVTLFWALAPGGLLAGTVLQVLRRLHGRSSYRFLASVPAFLTQADGSMTPVSTEDLSQYGCSILTDAHATFARRPALTLDLPDGPLKIQVDVVHDRALADGGRRLGVRFRGMAALDRERLIEFLFVTVARWQGQSTPLRDWLRAPVARELAA
jgi:cellulose synthase (UDP-forming)